MSDAAMIPVRARHPAPRHVVVLTGAGISAASGIAPYRGPGGLWTANPALASSLVAGMDPAKLWEVILEWRRIVARAEPNVAHRVLAAFEERFTADGGTFALVTQNVDGLHAKAGSKNVIELHGALRRSRCSDDACRLARFSDERDSGAVPACPECGAPVRPDVILFNEALGPLEEWSAKKALRDVDLFVAIGTSGMVSPASNFVRSAEYVGAHTILLNLDVPVERTPFAEVHQGEAEELVARLFA